MLTYKNPLYKDNLHPSNLAGTRSLRSDIEYYRGVANSRNDTIGGLANKELSGSTAEMATFNRYGIAFPEEELSSTLAYVFIVRPDLNIVESYDHDTINLTPQCDTNLYYYYLRQTDPTILKGLTQTRCGSYTHHFVPFLMDRVETYQIPSFNLDMHEMTQPFSGFKTTYAGNGNQYQSGQEFTIQFRETSSLRVLKFFKAWVDYINGIALNLFAPKDEYVRAKYLEGTQVIDYATSVYLIRCKPNMEIIFFHKQTGAVPKNIPYENLSYNKGPSDTESLKEVSIEFAGGYPEALNPNTIAEFNYNSIPNASSAMNLEYAPEYDPMVGFSGNPIVGVPYIVFNRDQKKYFLCWKPADAR